MLLRIRLRLKPEQLLFWPVDSKPFPPEHKALTALIAQKGLLLSEQPLNLRPQAHHFPIQNRLISGLATQIIIVEAALKSGRFLTARNALDQGRDVLAVPGHPLDPRAAGCNALIRDGAALVRKTCLT